MRNSTVRCQGGVQPVAVVSTLALEHARRAAHPRVTRARIRKRRLERTPCCWLPVERRRQALDRAVLAATLAAASSGWTGCVLTVALPVAGSRRQVNHTPRVCFTGSSDGSSVPSGDPHVRDFGCWVFRRLVALSAPPIATCERARSKLDDSRRRQSHPRVPWDEKSCVHGAPRTCARAKESCEAR
jgi:hypothetical protein